MLLKNYAFETSFPEKYVPAHTPLHCLQLNFILLS
jgi:hypothetical protein